jgi:hypothetical protein
VAWKFKVCLVRRICMLTIFWECTFNTWQLLYLSCLTLLFLIFLPCAERAALDRQVMCLFLIQLHGSTYMTCMILSFIPTIGPRHSSTHRLISGTSGAHPKWSPDLRWPMKVRATSPSHPGSCKAASKAKLQREQPVGGARPPCQRACLFSSMNCFPMLVPLWIYKKCCPKQEPNR